MIIFKSRRAREFIIISRMIHFYCLRHHQPENSLCDNCNDLLAYAKKRLDKCKFGDSKPVCKDCIVHCYAQKQREEMRKVMRWAGPRMIYTYPLLALIHIMDSWHKNDKQTVI